MYIQDSSHFRDREIELSQVELNRMLMLAALLPVKCILRVLSQCLACTVSSTESVRFEGDHTILVPEFRPRRMTQNPHWTE